MSSLPQSPVPGAYTVNAGISSLSVQVPFFSTGAPSVYSINFPVGKRWIDVTNDATYTLTSFNSSGGVTTAVWVLEGGGSGAVASLVSDSGTATPTGGAITIAGGTNINTTASGSTLSVNLDNTITITGDISSSSSTAGNPQTIAVSNLDNTNGASDAEFIAATGGASGGDPSTVYTVTGAQTWSTGIDNSASDAYVIAASDTLGSTNVMSMATTGTVSVLLGDFTVNRSTAGNNVLSEVTNSDNTNAASNAYFQAAVGGASAGDAAIQFQISGGQNWTVGLDNSASDALVIAASNALGTTDVLTATVSGDVTAVLGDLFAARTDVGGDVVISAQNADNTNAASRSIISCITGGASGGDPMTQYIVSAAQTWSVGVDNSVADDPYTISASATLGTSNAMTLSTTGIMTVEGGVNSTTGTFTCLGAGQGVAFQVSTGSGAAAGTVNCNGRVGSVTFTGPNIAAAATQSLVVGNTSIAGASTVVLYSMRGATTGAAICIQSVTNAANQSTIVVENGTGATAQTGDLTFDFIVLN